MRIFSDEIRVKAQIYTIGGFSAHADQTELLEWHSHTRASRTFLVHGDEEVMGKFAARLTNTKVELPKQGQTIEL